MKGKHVKERTYLNIKNQRNPRGENNNRINNPERNRIQNFTLFSFSGLHVGMRRNNDNTNINIQIENNSNRENNINPILNANIRGKNIIKIFSIILF